MAEKKEGAVFEAVTSGSIARIVKESDAHLIVAIGTYDAYAVDKEAVENVLSSKSLQGLLRETDKKVVVAIGSYDAFEKAN